MVGARYGSGGAESDSLLVEEHMDEAQDLGGSCGDDMDLDVAEISSESTNDSWSG